MTNVAKGTENLIGASTYLVFFFSGIFFLLIEKQSKFVRFHAMQSTIVFGGLFIINLILRYLPIIGPIIGLALNFMAFIAWVMLWATDRIRRNVSI